MEDQKMPAQAPLKPRQLKAALQAKTATRRSMHQAETRAVTGIRRNDLQPSLSTVSKPVAALIPSASRTRQTTPQILESTIRSIMQFGMVLPILIDKHDRIVAGHALWEAATRLGFETVECRVADHLEPLELEALALALNRIGEIGSYDLDKLRDGMIRIESAGIELLSTGFTLPEIDQIKLGPIVSEREDEEEQPTSFVTSVPGDLFILGSHVVLCGDALEATSWERVLGGRRANAVFSDAPYNCKIEGFVGGLGQHKHEDFLRFSGKESEAEFSAFLKAYLEQCRAFTRPGAVIFACMDWRQIDALLQAGRAAGLARINVAVWNKGAGGMGGLYRSAHEFVAVFCNGKTPATNNVALGTHGRDRTNVWTYAGANRKGSSAAGALADHPTPKPVELVVDALLDVTSPRDVVVDPFLGSGTTVIAAESSGRCACGIELDPKYVDRAILRWEQMTGKDAVHADSGLTFAELSAQRRSPTKTH